MTKLPWMIAGAVVAAVGVTLVVATGDDAPAPTSADRPGYDLSSPTAAAESFARAARTRSGNTLLTLTCVGHADCVHEHAADLTETQLDEARATIRDGVYELAEHLKGAEFTTAVDGQEPGTMNVPYRTPAMTSSLTLTFVRSGHDWLYYLPVAG